MTHAALEHWAWGAAGVGGLGCAIGWIATPVLFPHAWLAALTCWIGWPLGSLALLLAHSLTGGRWGETLRPQLVAGMLTLPLIVPALIPIVFVLPALYPWARPEVAAQLGNRFYLNLPFATWRMVFYVIVWLLLGTMVLRRLAADPASLAKIAPPGLILLAFTASFAAIDATMSLDPGFASSVYGMIAAAESGLFALSIATFASAVASTAERLSQSFGRLLLGLLVLWAYLDFVQLLIVWQSDLINESPWYVARSSGMWSIIAAVIALGHFVLPFFALLSARVQRSRRGVIAVTALLIAMEVPRAWWLVLPAVPRGIGLVDIAAMLAIFGVAAVLALRAPSLAGAIGRYG